MPSRAHTPAPPSFTFAHLGAAFALLLFASFSALAIALVGQSLEHMGQAPSPSPVWDLPAYLARLGASLTDGQAAGLAGLCVSTVTALLLAVLLTSKDAASEVVEPLKLVGFLASAVGATVLLLTAAMLWSARPHSAWWWEALVCLGSAALLVILPSLMQPSSDLLRYQLAVQRDELRNGQQALAELNATLGLLGEARLKARRRVGAEAKTALMVIGTVAAVALGVGLPLWGSIPDARGAVAAALASAVCALPAWVLIRYRLFCDAKRHLKRPDALTPPFATLTVVALYSLVVLYLLLWIRQQVDHRASTPGFGFVIITSVACVAGLLWVSVDGRLADRVIKPQMDFREQLVREHVLRMLQSLRRRIQGTEEKLTAENDPVTALLGGPRMPRRSRAARPARLRRRPASGVHASGRADSQPARRGPAGRLR